MYFQLKHKIATRLFKYGDREDGRYRRENKENDKGNPVLVVSRFLLLGRMCIRLADPKLFELILIFSFFFPSRNPIVTSPVIRMRRTL